jgi:hypothetical protein
MIDRYEFKIRYFEETGKWLTEKGLNEEYETYIRREEEYRQEMIEMLKND